ncbi:Ribonuclease H, putative [Candida maltosa Xu316]|uniref:Ribonuclease H n=1 Tax=Candida maltosa (strain Xu316) TaxID=1245528 RepID=M3J7Q2_CANMX|nr:Ribonuclease H, putative [Candida maltosa Xu316]
MAYYAVVEGRTSGIYYCWDHCRNQVHRYSGANYRKFDDYEDAAYYMNRYGFNEYTPSTYNTYPIYVDGACRGNGRHYARAGYGVYYGRDDCRNASVPLSDLDEDNDYPPTNQRAELYAIKHALQDIWDDICDGSACEKAHIYSDSQYAINCIIEWGTMWEQNGWINSKGNTISNDDVVKRINKLYDWITEEYEDRGWGSLSLTHVRGHSGNYGNEQADWLANEAVDNY